MTAAPMPIGCEIADGDDLTCLTIAGASTWDEIVWSRRLQLSTEHAQVGF
jgi:hypothetical protein